MCGCVCWGGGDGWKFCVSFWRVGVLFRRSFWWLYLCIGCVVWIMLHVFLYGEYKQGRGGGVREG